jgi:hypothetical protein
VVPAREPVSIVTMGEPVLVVEEILKRLDQVGPDQQEFKLYVPPLVAMDNKAVAQDTGMAVILDRLLSMGFSPKGVFPMGKGKIYKYVRGF